MPCRSHGYRGVVLHNKGVGASVGRYGCGQFVFSGKREGPGGEAQLGDLSSNQSVVDYGDVGACGLPHSHGAKIYAAWRDLEGSRAGCVDYEMRTTAGEGCGKEAARDREKRFRVRPVKTAGISATGRPASVKSRWTLEKKCVAFCECLAPRRKTEGLTHLLHLSKCPSNRNDPSSFRRSILFFEAIARFNLQGATAASFLRYLDHNTCPLDVSNLLLLLHLISWG